MATESTTPPLHTPTVTDEQPVESKEKMEEETVSLAKQAKEGEESACAQKPFPKSEGEAAGKPTESIAEFAKLGEQPAAPSAVETLQEQPKVVDFPESLIGNVEKPKELSEILPSKTSEQVVAKGFLQQVDIPKADMKPEEQSVEEIGKPVKESVEELSSDIDKQAEKPKEAEQVESIEKQQQSTESKVVKELPVDTKREDKPEPAKEEPAKSNDVESKGGDKPELTKEGPAESNDRDKTEAAVPELFHLHLWSLHAKEEPAKFKDVNKPLPDKEESLETRGDRPQLAKEVPAESNDGDKTEAAVPEVEVKPKDESQVTDKVEINLTDAKTEAAVTQVEAKPEGQVEVKPTDESQVADKVEINLTDGKTEAAVPQVQAKPEGQVEVKPKDESQITDKVEIILTVEKTEAAVPEVEVKEDEKPKVPDPEVEVKPKEESQVIDKVEIKSTDVKTDPVITDVKEENEFAGKDEPKESINSETVINEEKQANKVADTSLVAQEKICKEDQPSATSEQVTEKATVEDGKKETGTAIGVDAPPKLAEVEIEKGEEEKGETTNQTEGENAGKDVLKEESAEPIKVDNDVNKDNVNTQVVERSLEGEKTDKDAVEENKKEGTPASVETRKDRSTEVTAPVSGQGELSRESGLEVKEKGNQKTFEEKGSVNEETKSSDDDDAKTEDQPREVPVKAAPKQSNNILSKVKMSFVKAKKAIIGKSPSSKTNTPDTKGDSKVK